MNDLILKMYSVAKCSVKFKSPVVYQQNADLGSEDQASDRSSTSDTSSNVASRPLRRSDRIAKDTGCCLYSAISALVTMLVIPMKI